MTGNEYQDLAMRTNDGKSKDRLIYIISSNNGAVDIAGLLNGCLGLAGEAGELLDLFKKCFFHGKEFDEDHAKKEIGDVMWYVAMICKSMGWNLDEILQMNIDKLKARYPEGFDPNRSNHRTEGDV